MVRSKETKEPYPELVNKTIENALQEGLLIENAGTYGNVIRFLCPLTVTDQQLDVGLAILERAMVKAAESLA